MIETPVIVGHEDGIEGRPIALLVQEASQYASKVYIQVDNKKINAKSIMGMMSLALQEGDEVTVVAEGEDEEKAAEGIKTFFEKDKIDDVVKGAVRRHSLSRIERRERAI